MAYPGGKGNSYRRIIAAMPTHATYIETHLGGGAVMRHKRPSVQQIGIDADPAVIEMWQSRPSIPCELVCGDAVTFLRTYPFEGNELVYCDPPYPWSTRRSKNGYRRDYSDRDHEELLATLNALNCAVIISGNAQDETYRRRLADWRRIDFQAGARRGARTETLWANFEAPRSLHDPRFRGDDFRERERLKRRMAALTRRVEQLDSTERDIFALWFSDRFAPELASVVKSLR
jgi:DNA adenine methylase